MIPEYIKLSSGAVEAVFAENRYRGTRFDRAGEIVSLKLPKTATAARVSTARAKSYP